MLVSHIWIFTCQTSKTCEIHMSDWKYHVRLANKSHVWPVTYKRSIKKKEETKLERIVVAAAVDAAAVVAVIVVKSFEPGSSLFLHFRLN